MSVSTKAFISRMSRALPGGVISIKLVIFVEVCDVIKYAKFEVCGLIGSSQRDGAMRH